MLKLVVMHIHFLLWPATFNTLAQLLEFLQKHFLLRIQVFQSMLIVVSLIQEVNNCILINKIGIIVQPMLIFFRNVFL